MVGRQVAGFGASSTTHGALGIGRKAVRIGRGCQRTMCGRPAAMSLLMDFGITLWQDAALCLRRCISVPVSLCGRVTHTRPQSPSIWHCSLSNFSCGRPIIIITLVTTMRLVIIRADSSLPIPIKATAPVMIRSSRISAGNTARITAGKRVLQKPISTVAIMRMPGRRALGQPFRRFKPSRLRANRTTS